MKKNISRNIYDCIKTTVQNPLRLITLIIPPVAVMIIILAVFAMNGMYPFGEKTLALCDMHQQVVPLMLDFKDILAGKADFFLNMQNASGMNFYGVFLFFISSPFTFLVAFIDKADIMDFMNILTMLKMMTCAVTANAYFRRCHKKLNLSFSALLSVMYAFSGYAMLFFQNTVWLDVMALFPLLLMSFESLTKSRKTGGFIFCLTGMLVLNYYLSYMVVLFTVLYFGMYLYIYRKKNVKGTASHFAVGCVIAAMLSAVIWLPSFAQFLSSARGSDTIDGLLRSDIFTTIYTNLPLLFCTGFGIAALITFFARKPSRRSRFYTALLIMLLLPVIFEPINKMWHTGDYMAFPVRYGYITTFMLLIFTAIKLKQLNFAEKSSKRFVIPAAAAVFAFCGFTIWYYLNYRTSLDAYATTLWGNFDSFILILIITCAFTAMYMFCILCSVFGKMSYRVFCCLVSLVLVFECFFSSNVYISSSAYVPSHFDKAIVLEDKIPQDDDFYRVKLAQSQQKYFDANLIGGLGYNTIAHYTSLTSEDYMFSMKRMGYSSYWMEVTGNGGTRLTDALMSIKYTIKRFTASDNAVYRDMNFSILKNENYLPLGLITDSDLSLSEDLPDGERIDVQEYLASVLLGSKERLFIEYEPTDLINAAYKHKDGVYYYSRIDKTHSSTIRYKMNVSGKQTLYFDCFDKVTRRVNEHINYKLSVFVNGVKADLAFPNKDSNGLLELGTFEDETVSVDVDVRENGYASSFGLYGLDCDKLTALLDNAQTAGLTVDGNVIDGTVNNAKAGQHMFLAVPYDKGFTAYVNGQRTKILRSMGGFMAIPLQEGVNEIRFEFLPPGFKIGLIISIMGAITAVLWTVFRKKFMVLLTKLDTVCRIGVYALTAAIVLAVYILPVIICLAGYFII